MQAFVKIYFPDTYKYLCKNAIKPLKIRPGEVIASMCLYYSKVFNTHYGKYIQKSCGQFLSKTIKYDSKRKKNAIYGLEMVQTSAWSKL